MRLVETVGADGIGRPAMLDAFIIEELRRRREDERAEAERPQLQLPIDDDHRDDDLEGGTHEGKRGVIVIDMC